MSILWFVAGLVLILIGTVCAVGALLPRDHQASASVVIPAPRDQVWAAVRDVASSTSWRTSLKSVAITGGPPDAPTAWTEVAASGAIKLQLVRADPPATLETRVDDRGQPFGGSWTFDFTPADADPAKTRVRITEHGFVKLPPFRFIARFFLGHHATISSYLNDLGAKFGASEPVALE
ncbi:MAG: SRPBCC family protein [Phycisphaerales bacterium]